jgi:hypothetical protein
MVDRIVQAIAIAVLALAWPFVAFLALILWMMMGIRRDDS